MSATGPRLDPVPLSLLVSQGTIFQNCNLARPPPPCRCGCGMMCSIFRVTERVGRRHFQGARTPGSWGDTDSTARGSLRAAVRDGVIMHARQQNRKKGVLILTGHGYWESGGVCPHRASRPHSNKSKKKTDAVRTDDSGAHGSHSPGGSSLPVLLPRDMKHAKSWQSEGALGLLLCRVLWGTTVAFAIKNQKKGTRLGK